MGRSPQIIKQRPWVYVSDRAWSMLKETVIGDDIYYRNQDIDEFVKRVFQNVAIETGFSYNEVKPILRDENREFFEEKRKMAKISGGTLNATQVSFLRRKLKVPKVSSFYV